MQADPTPGKTISADPLRYDPAFCGANAAIANAVYNACGVRIRSFPLTLDKLIAGLDANV